MTNRVSALLQELIDRVADEKEHTTDGVRAERAAEATSKEYVPDVVLYAKALEIVFEVGKASTALLRRRLSIGYSRAARLIKRMTAEGLISPLAGQKARDLLLTRAEYAVKRPLWAAFDSEPREQLYAAALEVVFAQGRASTSLIQRKLLLGFGEVVRLVERMEAEGVVSSHAGVGGRELLLTLEEYLARRSRMQELPR